MKTVKDHDKKSNVCALTATIQTNIFVMLLFLISNGWKYLEKDTLPQSKRIMDFKLSTSRSG